MELNEITKEVVDLEELSPQEGYMERDCRAEPWAVSGEWPFWP